MIIGPSAGRFYLKGSTDNTLIGNKADSLKTHNTNDMDSPSFVDISPNQRDAFGRIRVSNPSNLFEYTFKYDIDFNAYWDTETITGGTVTHDSDKVSRFLNVTSSTNSKAVMQTRRRLEYNAGESHLFLFSINFRGANTGIRKRIGMFDDNNGMYFETDGTTLKVVIRSKTSGSVADIPVSQASWNGDKYDGSGPSGSSFDSENGQLLFIDFAWLGIGLVRFGALIDGKFIALHVAYIANNQTNPFMQSPHLPFRLELENTAGGSADNMSAVCCSYKVEGNPGKLGKVRPWYSGNTAVTINNEEVLYIGRINPAYPYSSAIFEKIKLMVETGSDEISVKIYQNPTITSGAITWNDEPNSIIQTANNPNSVSINTSTGFIIDSDILRTDGEVDLDNSDVYFGLDIAGEPDIFVITADSLNAGADVVLSVATREFY